MTMTKRERLAAAVAGQPVDRVPVALWRHFPVDDVNPEELAQSAAAFQQQYDWDFIKLTPSSHYSVDGWGTEVAYYGHPHGTSDYITFPVKEAADWGRLKPLDIHKGMYGEQLVCVRRLRELVGDEVPFIETIFSPMDQARHLIGRGKELVHMRRYPEQMQAALEMLTDITIAFVKAVLDAGADGIFYATQYATAAVMSREEYMQICRPLDLKILQAAQGASFNMFHLHGKHTYFDLVADYPIHALNWHDRETGPSLEDGKQQFAGMVMGGISQQEIVEATPAEITRLAKEAVESTQATRMGLATGCVVPTVAPWGNMRALRAAADG
jgi:uroporphyrinogen decarboxylase